MRIRLTSIPVNDQEQALQFYTETLGFVVKLDLPLGEYRWLTVVSPEEPDAAELLLEPNAHAAAKAFQSALFDDGIPAASFEVSDVTKEHARLSGLGVEFRMEPTEMGGTTVATLNDTCGNLVQIYEAPA